MLYKKLGKAGLDVSVVGFGAEHLVGMPRADVERILGAAFETGMNITDVFMPQREVRETIGGFVAPRRKEMAIQAHFGSVMTNGQPDRTRDLKLAVPAFEEYFELFQTDYMDIGMMFYIDTEREFDESFNSGYAETLARYKKEGRIRAIGASSHNPVTAKRIVETGAVDMLMFAVNPAYDMLPGSFDIMDCFDEKINGSLAGGMHPERAALYETCEREGVGITTMKTAGGGRLLSAELSPFKKGLSMAQCIHYALTRPAVASCLIGCKSAAEVYEAANYVNLPDEARDYSQIALYYSADMLGKCVYCNHCLPCPQNIDIAGVTRLLDICSGMSGVSAAGERAAGLASAEGCVKCGSCEASCPFGVKAMKNMEDAASLANARQ